IRIIRVSGARGIISHHKSTGRENWGKVTESLRMIDAANAEGLEIYCDVYPYIASHTSLTPTFIPKQYQDGGFSKVLERLADPACRAEMKAKLMERRNGDYSYILVVRCPAYPEYEGKRIDEIAAIHGKDQIETAFDLMLHSKNGCGACFFTMREEDVETVLAHPRAMICTDSGVAGNNRMYHPRLRATFPRVLGHYVRERGVTSLPEMIRKMTAMPAAVYGLQSKGILRAGMDADICIFDPDTIIDRAEYADPSKHAEGLDFVIVGGKIAVENAYATGELGGHVLLRE
ncbi:MAG: amidohydrolase family protein, partial [Clostridia bacterium]|nr:amidohydrolase family protein [Clostridia bacterium]